MIWSLNIVFNLTTFDRFADRFNSIIEFLLFRCSFILWFIRYFLYSDLLLLDKCSILLYLWLEWLFSFNFVRFISLTFPMISIISFKHPFSISHFKPLLRSPLHPLLASLPNRIFHEHYFFDKIDPHLLAKHHRFSIPLIIILPLIPIHISPPSFLLWQTNPDLFARIWIWIRGLNCLKVYFYHHAFMRLNDQFEINDGICWLTERHIFQGDSAGKLPLKEIVFFVPGRQRYCGVT